MVCLCGTHDVVIRVFKKEASRLKYFVMCFSEYLENQNHKQMYLLVREASHCTSSSRMHNAQFQILTFCFPGRVPWSRQSLLPVLWGVAEEEPHPAQMQGAETE